MSRYQANPTVDGYIYTKNGGLVSGLRTYGVIQPESNVRNVDKSNVWEAIVIGAGYAGLIAARDLVKAGELDRISRIDRTIVDIAQARRRFCWKLVIALVAGLGVQKSMALLSRWAVHGCRMSMAACSLKCSGTASRTKSQ